MKPASRFRSSCPRATTVASLAGRSAAARAQVNGDDTSVTDCFIGLPDALASAPGAGDQPARAHGSAHGRSVTAARAQVQYAGRCWQRMPAHGQHVTRNVGAGAMASARGDTRTLMASQRRPAVDVGEGGFGSGVLRVGRDNGAMGLVCCCFDGMACRLHDTCRACGRPQLQLGFPYWGTHYSDPGRAVARYTRDNDGLEYGVGSLSSVAIGRTRGRERQLAVQYGRTMRLGD